MKKAGLFALIVFCVISVWAQQKVIYRMLPDTGAFHKMIGLDTPGQEKELQLLRNLLPSRIEAEQFVYTLHDSVILLERSPFPGTRYIYAARGLEYLVQETGPNGKISVSKMDMDYKKFPGWQVRYDVKKFPGETRSILGYNCYKVLLDEYKTIEGKTDVRKIELWVTGRIALPAFIVAALYEQVVTECPLEMRVWSEPASKPHTTVVVESIQQ